jgi:hypothetical protein
LLEVINDLNLDNYYFFTRWRKMPPYIYIPRVYLISFDPWGPKCRQWYILNRATTAFW